MDDDLGRCYLFPKISIISAVGIVVLNNDVCQFKYAAGIYTSQSYKRGKAGVTCKAPAIIFSSNFIVFHSSYRSIDAGIRQLEDAWGFSFILNAAPGANCVYS